MYTYSYGTMEDPKDRRIEDLESENRALETLIEVYREIIFDLPENKRLLAREAEKVYKNKIAEIYKRRLC